MCVCVCVCVCVRACVRACVHACVCVCVTLPPTYIRDAVDLVSDDTEALGLN